MDLSAYQSQDHNKNENKNYQKNTHDNAKIFVGGLSWQTTEETLRYHFEQYGEVVSVEVMKDRNTGDPRGFAFVVFKEDATVELVMSNLPHEINHKVVDVKRAQARGAAPPSIHGLTPNNSTSGGRYNKFNTHNDDDSSIVSKSTNQSSYYNNNNSSNSNNPDEPTPEQLQNKIFIGGLPIHLTKEGLQDFFSQFGTVVDAIIMMDQMQNRSRGFGFVTFENGSGGAQKALQSQPLYIDQKYVEIKLATPREQQNNTGGGTGGGAGGHRGSKPNNQGYHSNVGLRNANAASMAQQSNSPFAGLAASYGRSGWRAGYGTVAFGSYGWNVKGWEDITKAPERHGFSFDLIRKTQQTKSKSARKRGNTGTSSEQQGKGSKRQRQS